MRIRCWGIRDRRVGTPGTRVMRPHRVFGLLDLPRLSRGVQCPLHSVGTWTLEQTPRNSTCVRILRGQGGGGGLHEVLDQLWLSGGVRHRAENHPGPPSTRTERVLSPGSTSVALTSD